MRSLAVTSAVTLALLGGVTCSRDRGHADQTASSAVTAAAAAASPSNGGEVWGASYFPNIPLVTHRGEQVRFFDDVIKGKIVAINFIYTTCTDACPMETARLLEVQKLLGDRFGKDVFFYSITIDPAHDTPEVLAAYAANWKTGAGWTFLTGDEADIVYLRKKLGVYEPDDQRTDHALSVLIGNQKTGRWMKRSPYESSHVMASQLSGWLDSWKTPSPADHGYEHAPVLRNLTAGEDLFRTRCATCHTVGGGVRTSGEAIGPDLLDVTTRRDRAWLVRWIMHPDQMIAERDPIVVEMLARFRGIPMPNLRLNQGEAERLVGYLEDESAGVHRRARQADLPGGQALLPTPAPVVVTDATAELLDAYDAMRASLAADDLETSQAGWERLAHAATRASTAAGAASPRLQDLAVAARAVGTAEDVATARLAFGDLSRLVVSLLADNPTLRAGRYLFLCPMAKGYQKWIQRDPTLANPYFGSEMLRCGRQVTAWSS